MAYGDNPQGVGELATALSVVYKLNDTAQFTRAGDTARWFEAQKESMPGRRFVFPMYVQPITSARMSDFATARTGVFPTAQDLTHIFMSYDYEDQVMVRATVKVNETDLTRLDGGDDALYNLATKLFSETAEDMAGRMNNAMHQNTSCQMATVGAKYLATGATYSQNATCYIKIASGSIAQFLPGMKLTINSLNVTVNDVNFEPDGPHPLGGGARVSGIGPGITVTSATHCDTISATNAIALSGEGASDNFLGFPSWFSASTNVYNDEAGAAVDRDAVGSSWQIPFLYTVAAAGSEVVLDMDTHIGKLCDILAMAVNSGRKKRRDQGISVGNALTAITTPDLVVEATREGYAAGRITTAMAVSESDAESKKLFARVGFNGAVYHHPNIGYVAFQGDKVATPYKVRILEPASWHWLEAGAGHGGIKWLENDGGGRFHRITEAGYGLTFFQEAGCYTTTMLYCDQPKANAEISGVKSSI
jgi:hypothetical protein